MTMNLLLIIFQISILVKINFSQLDLLKIDPLSIYVDPMLHQFCWKYLGDFKDNHIFGINDKNQEITLSVFQNNQNSNKSYCITHRDIGKNMVINLPFNKYNLKEVFALSITLSKPMGPKLEVIRFKAGPNGIVFQLNNEFGSISISELVKCNVTMIYKNNGKKFVNQFSISSQNNKVYQKLNEKSSITAYSTCVVPGIIDVSTRFMKYDGYTLYSDSTMDLLPLIPLPLKRFLMVAWKHPTNIPHIYNIAIYEKFQSGEEICMKIFRMKNEFIRKSKWKTIVSQCHSKIATDDLGYYNGRNSHVFAILDLISPLNIYSNYKLSIFWENDQAEINENFLYFTPLPNDNNAFIITSFLNYMKFNYEEIRSKISSFNQNFIPVNEINPVMDNKINFTGYDEYTILPSISDKNELIYKEIKNSDKEKFIQECMNCSNGIYPFFYLLLLSDTKKEELYVEIVQIPLKTDNNFKISDVFLLANNEDLTFNVSWKITKGTINPGIYGIQIMETQSNRCEAYYIFKCNTCNRKYIETSEVNLPKLSDCKSIIIVKENQFTAASKYLSFTTNKISDSIIYRARVFAVVFSKVYQSGLSNGEFIKDNSGKKTLFLSLACVFVIFVIAIIITGLALRYKKAKSMKEVTANVKQSNESLYDEDVDDYHTHINDNKTSHKEKENEYELI